MLAAVGAAGVARGSAFSLVLADRGVEGKSLQLGDQAPEWLPIRGLSAKQPTLPHRGRSKVWQYQDAMNIISNNIHNDYRSLYKKLRVLLRDSLNSLIVTVRINERDSEAERRARARPSWNRVKSMAATERHGDGLWTINNSDSQIRILCLDSGREVELFRGVPGPDSHRGETA